MTSIEITTFERTLLEELAETGDCSPGGLAIALDTDLSTVLSTTNELQKRGLIARRDFDSCHLTDRGRELVASDQ